MSCLLLAAIAISSLGAYGQSKATARTEGSCSPVVSGNNNQLSVQCPGLTAGQLQELLRSIKRSGADVQRVLTAVHELNDNIETLIPKTIGELLPGDDKDPPSDCVYPIPQDAFKMYIGGGTYVASFDKPNRSVFVPIRIAGEDVLSMRLSERGSLLISAVVRSKDGRIVAKVEDGKFKINPANALPAESTNSSLTVHDETGELALDVKFLNPHAVRISGTFHKDGRTVIITNHDIVLLPNGSSIAGGCTMRSSIGIDYR